MNPHESAYVTDWLAKRAGLTPDRVGLIEGLGGAQITYSAWNARVNQTANYLRSLGVEKGDLVSVYSSNCPEFVDLFWAAGKIGAILQNLNWRLTVHELREIVTDAEPRVLFYSPDWCSQVEELRPSLDSIREVIAFGEPAPATTRSRSVTGSPNGSRTFPISRSIILGASTTRVAPPVYPRALS